MAVIVIVAVFWYGLLQVDDVSAQCVINPDLDSLTIANGLVRSIEFHCQCMGGNAMWLLSNGNSAPTQNFNIPPAVLFIADQFESSDAGTYTCSPNNMLNDPSRDTITLSAGTPSVFQRVCRIYSPSLTTNGGMIDIPSGTQNVILYCICTRNGVAVGPATWSFGSTAITTTVSGNNPYSRDNVPAPLIIPSFNASHVGTYSCVNVNGNATIDLALSANVGNDPHFFLPLPNGDNLCFSVQGQPDFMFSLIKDRYVQLNAQFVLPAEDESHTIANVSTFLGNLGLLLRNPVTGNTTAIKVSAEHHTVLVDGSVITVKDKPVTVQISNTFIVDITIDVNQQVHTIKDGSAWLYIYTEFGFGIKVRFYKKHLDLFLTKTSGLTNEAHGIIGQFLSSNVEVDNENNLLKFGNRKPISVRKGPAWPYLHIDEDCWYGTATDNQGTGVIEGNYMDYIVQELIC